MKDNKEKNYLFDDFIYKYQFERKVSAESYLLTKKSIFILTLAQVILYYHWQEKYWQLIVVALIAYLVRSYFITNLRYDAPLNTIPYDDHDDEKLGAILLISKMNWAKKRFLEKAREGNIKNVFK